MGAPMGRRARSRGRPRARAGVDTRGLGGRAAASGPRASSNAGRAAAFGADRVDRALSRRRRTSDALVLVRDGHIFAARIFKSRAPVASTKASAPAAAMNAALFKLMAQIANFVVANL